MPGSPACFERVDGCRGSGQLAWLIPGTGQPIFSSMSSRLPLFPLQLVLFPGEPVPLHIFEARYRQLLADCLSGDQRFGITSHPNPGPGTIGCRVEIRGTQPLPDGRSNIVVVGEQRFVVRGLLDEGTPYLLASVEEFADTPGSAPLAAEREALRGLATEYRDALALIADNPGQSPDWSDDAEQFTFQVAAITQLDLEIKERLLAFRSTRERARALLGVLPSLLQITRGHAAVHVGARSNGKGHPGHDIVTDG